MFIIPLLKKLYFINFIKKEVCAVGGEKPSAQNEEELILFNNYEVKL